MKTFAIGLVLVLFAISYNVMAKSDYVQAGQFNISLDINKIHEIDIEESNGMNQSIIYKTFDGHADIRIYKPDAMSAPDRLKYLISFNKNFSSDTIVVDEKKGVIYFQFEGSHPEYTILYALDNTSAVSISSTMPFLDTARLLETIHITKND